LQEIRGSSAAGSSSTDTPTNLWGWSREALVLAWRAVKSVKDPNDRGVGLKPEGCSDR
jgi:hypothetical protein